MGSGGRSGSVPTGEGGAIPDISINGFDGTREPARGLEEEHAEDAALPGRLGPTSVASGASSESDEEELEDDEDEDEERRCTELFGGGIGPEEAGKQCPRDDRSEKGKHTDPTDIQSAIPGLLCCTGE